MRNSTILLVLALAGCGPKSTPGQDEPDAPPGNPPDAAAIGTETCGDGLDGDGDGEIDEGCACSSGQTQPCYPGPAGEVGVGPCLHGVQACSADVEGGTWGTCAGAVGPAVETCNLIDDDCDGTVDDGLPECMVIDVSIDIDGDCVYASCPPEAPYPIGCMITMEGGDSRGCVAMSGVSGIYFQEGDKCGAGHVSGTLTCSTSPGAPLSEANCPINKPDKFYPADPLGCPELQD